LTAADETEFLQRMKRIEALLQALDRSTDPDARTAARELVQALLELHGAGLAKLMELTADVGDVARLLVESFTDDGLVANLLLLHNLHPVGLEGRVRKAVDRLRPQVRASGGDVKLVEVKDGVVRLLVTESAETGRPDDALRRAIEDAIQGAAPDAVGIEIEVAPAEPPEKRLIPLPVLGRSP
jgi:Fe-S cluster biogenesis protein NfuA